MIRSRCVFAALIVALVFGVQGHQIIYVDTENGTLNNSCWEGGLDNPCSNLELANTGAQRYNSTIAVLLRYGTSHNTSTTAPTTSRVFTYPQLATTGNSIFKCGPTDNKCNEPASNCTCRCNEGNYQKYIYSRNVSCPPWFEPDNGTCRCGEGVHGIVKCNETLQESGILDCYCMTYNEVTGTVVSGACLYNCVNNALKDAVYLPMPNALEHLNDAMCGRLNRGGQLCGECKTNYSPPVYSYDLECTMCSGEQYNWIKYVAIAFVPLTVFLVLVLCCRISATSPQLYAFVMYSQFIAIPANVRIIFAAIKGIDRADASVAFQILSTLYGVWNLDFFRTLIPHTICLKVDTLQVLALDYSIAFYPLALIVVTYVLIELHAHNFRVIVWTWRPFHRCFARFRQQWDIKTSIVDAFATFLLLSNIKLLSVSFDLLTPTSVYNINGSVVGIYLYYDASIEYFGTKKHLPYAIVAVFVVLIFIIFPILLLLLYPMRWFQRCLGLCRVKWHALPIFIDAFQGCYKDGTNGTRDCRYFAGVYLFVRLIFFILIAITRNAVFYALAVLLLVSVAISLAIVQPYKAEFAVYNVVDLVFVLAMAMWCGAAVFYCTAAVKARYLLKTSVVVLSLLAVLPLLYLVVIFLRWICSRNKVGQKLVQIIKSQIGSVCRRTHGTKLEESLPDRLINPRFYQEDFSMANSSDRFYNQAYSSVSNDESTMI